MVVRLCLTGLLCGPALADSSPRWLEVKTAHFTVLTDAGDRRARETAAQFERMHALFAKLMPGAAEDPGSEILVLALKNRKDFQSVEPTAYLAKNALDVSGLFMQRQDRSYILLRLDAEGEHPYATVYHEYTHYMNRHDQNLPVWLDEGLAQFFQNTDLDDKTARLGQPSQGELELLREEKLMPLATLFVVDHNSPYYREEDKGDIFYAESWALTHMLFIRDFANHTDRLHQYEVDIAHAEDSVAAAEHAFGDLKRLQRDLVDYVNGSRFSELRMPLQNTIKESDLTTEPIPTADADAIRADVLVECGRRDEAKALIEAVLREEPGNPQAHESMGLLDLRQGDFAEARKWYGEAVALHSTSYLSYYYFGLLSMQIGHVRADDPTDQQASAALHEAVRMGPEFAPAAAALGEYDLSHGPLNEAAQMTLRAVELAPSNIGYRLQAAQICVQGDDFISAVSILKGAEQIARAPEDRERVRVRLESVERDQAQLAEAKSATADGGALERTSAGSNRVEAAPDDDAPANPIPASWSDKSFPEGPPAGPRHTVKGVIHSVACFYPKGMTLELEGAAAKPVLLYSNDMYEVRYRASNLAPMKMLDPCHEIEGFKASVVYAEVKNKTAAGQIVSIALSK